MADERQIDLDLVVRPFGQNGMLMATSEKMRSLMISGTDEADLWDCLQPAISALFEAKGQRVPAITLDRTGGPDHIRVTAQLHPI